MWGSGARQSMESHFYIGRGGFAVIGVVSEMSNLGYKVLAMMPAQVNPPDNWASLMQASRQNKDVPSSSAR